VALAEVQLEYGLVKDAQVKDLIAHVEDIDLPKTLEIEAKINHDLMAELETYSMQCQVGGGILHLGATSVDIKDNSTILQMKASLDELLSKLRQLLKTLGTKISKYADTPIIAFTHLQPAEPSTLGYRLSQYGQDLLEDWEVLSQVRRALKGKGVKGAVGTSASFVALIGQENLTSFEARLSEKLKLPFYDITTQTYPRKQDFRVLSALAGLGASINKFAFDLRILQSPPIAELAEPFGKDQVGSSAMPFKRNPIRAEKINSLSRMLAQLPRIAWDNAAFSLLERTLDDSANRRSILPEAFLIADELLVSTQKIIEGLLVDRRAADRNLNIYGPFAAIEQVLMALGKSGANRQEMHKRLRQLSLIAWETIRQGKPNPLMRLVSTDGVLLNYLAEDVLIELMDARLYSGNASQKARQLVQEIEAIE
jgi:adenylosuccinate lyase